MSQADRDTLEALREAADAIDGDARAKLAALAAQYIPEMVQKARKVVNDDFSRQQLNAIALMAEWATGAEADGGKGATHTKVIVLSAAEVAKLGEMQRQAKEQQPPAAVVPLKHQTK
jgi:hypothetical protein